MHADLAGYSPPSDPASHFFKGQVYMDSAANIPALLAVSALLQFGSLFVLYLMADNLSALLKCYMVVHYETIAKWKYGKNTTVESTETTKGPVAVPPLHETNQSPQTSQR
jgi:hypothetical protein